MKVLLIIFTIYITTTINVYSQITDYDILSLVFQKDSSGMIREIVKSNNEFIFIENINFNSTKDDFKDFGFDVKIMNLLSYHRLKKKQKKRYPIVYFDNISINSDIITYLVKGARFYYKKKHRDHFFIFSEIEIKYKLNCETGFWELFEFKRY